eukprot:scaffold4669_cov70-Phaeocystis_antarctica.AAC.1
MFLGRSARRGVISNTPPTAPFVTSDSVGRGAAGSVGAALWRAHEHALVRARPLHARQQVARVAALELEGGLVVVALPPVVSLPIACLTLRGTGVGVLRLSRQYRVQRAELQSPAQLQPAGGRVVRPHEVRRDETVATLPRLHPHLVRVRVRVRVRLVEAQHRIGHATRALAAAREEPVGAEQLHPRLEVRRVVVPSRLAKAAAPRGDAAMRHREAIGDLWLG